MSCPFHQYLMSIYLVICTMENAQQNMDMGPLYLKLFRTCNVNTKFLVELNLKPYEYMNLVKDIVPWPGMPGEECIIRRKWSPEDSSLLTGQEKWRLKERHL